MKFLGDLRRYTNSYGENSESNCGALPITIGAFGASEFHSLVVNAKKSNPLTKKGKPPPRNKKTKTRRVF